MTVLHLPGQPPPSEPTSRIREEQMPDGSVRLVHDVKQPNGESAFIAFMADGSFVLRDAWGSMIMSNTQGDVLIQAARALVFNGKEILVRNGTTGESISILPEGVPPEEAPVES